MGGVGGAAMIFQRLPHTRERAGFTLSKELSRDIHLPATSHSPSKGQEWGWRVKVGGAGVGTFFCTGSSRLSLPRVIP